MADMTCDYRAAWDEDDQPVGPPCGERVTHIIVWPNEKAWSGSCANHHGDELFLDAPAHTVHEIAEFAKLGLG